MVKLNTPQALVGSPAPNFSIEFEGSIYSLSSIAGPSGTLIMFICNHCPYVKRIITNLVEDVRLMQGNGIGVIAIMPNDFVAYPDDSPEKMIEFARSNNFSFPYVPDISQDVAKKYDAVCTPDFFGFNDKLKLQYRGQFMDQETGTRDLLNAMIEIAKTGKVSAPQKPSIGCSIKWK